MDRSEIEVRAAKYLSTWSTSPRKTVALTLADYELMLFKIRPVMVAASSKDGVTTIQTVILNKDQAINYLKQEYQLHDVRTIRRNTFR